jgi:hypothetical protein
MGVQVQKDKPATKPIGLWCSQLEPDLPDPHKLVDHNWDPKERARVVAHSNAGRLRAQYCGLSPCRFCGIPNGSAELTDGHYHWPAGLPHYLQDHGVRLPARVVKGLLR